MKRVTAQLALGVVVDGGDEVEAEVKFTALAIMRDNVNHLLPS